MQFYLESQGFPLVASSVYEISRTCGSEKEQMEYELQFGYDNYICEFSAETYILNYDIVRITEILLMLNQVCNF